MLKPYQKDLIKHSYAFVDPVKKLTRLLHHYFGISGLWYQKTDQEGNIYSVADCPDLVYHSFKNNLEVDSPYLRHPDTFQQGLVFNCRSLQCESPDSCLRINGAAYDVKNTVTLINKLAGGGVEIFWLIGKPDNLQLSSLVANHHLLLKKFAEHFKCELKESFQEMEHETVHLPTFLPDNYFRGMSLPCKMTPERYHCLLESLGYQSLVQKSRSLSQRERDCLFLLLQGMTAKQIAATLHLSSRTVETYFCRMKVKFSCFNKGDLFKLAEALQSVNLI